MGATPWICYGQTAIDPNSEVHDPTPNVNGLVGECVSLPYTVPIGKILVLKMFQMEQLWGAAILPWIGETMADFMAAHCLSTMIGATAEPNPLPAALFRANLHYDGFNYQIPAGKTLHIRLNSGYSPSTGWIYGWYVGGELQDAV